MSHPDTSYQGSACNANALRIGAATALDEPWYHTNKEAHFFLPGAKVDKSNEAEYYYGPSFLSAMSGSSTSPHPQPQQQLQRQLQL